MKLEIAIDRAPCFNESLVLSPDHGELGPRLFPFGAFSTVVLAGQRLQSTWEALEQQINAVPLQRAEAHPLVVCSRWPWGLVVLMRAVNPQLLLVESGGDNLAAQYSRELVDYTVYVIDVAGGDKVPRKGGPGITQSDLLVINKTDLAPYVGASLEVMDRNAKTMRGDGLCASHPWNRRRPDRGPRGRGARRGVRQARSLTRALPDVQGVEAAQPVGGLGLETGLGHRLGKVPGGIRGEREVEDPGDGVEDLDQSPARIALLEHHQ